MNKTVKCRFCPTPIVFAVDGNGKRQVLDARAPVYVIEDDGTCNRMRGVYVSHWATCTGREQMKKAQADKGRR